MREPLQRLESAQLLLDGDQPSRALAVLGGFWPPQLRAEADFLRAEAWRAQGYFGRAAALYAAVLKTPRVVDESLALEAGLALASVHRSLGQVAAARARLGAAWALARKRKMDLTRFKLEDALIDRAAALWARSLGKLSRLLERARAGGDWGAAAFLLWARGGARRFSGDLAGAQRDFTRSLRVARRAGDPSGQVYALLGLGGVARIQGCLNESRRHYASATRRLALSDDVFGKAYAHCGLANALRQQGRLSEAERHYLRAHALYSSLGDAVDLAYVDWGLGKIALQRGRLRQARQRLTLACDAFDAAGEHRGVALAKLGLAAVLHALGQTQRAERLFDEAVRQSRRAGLHAHLELYT